MKRVALSSDRACDAVIDLEDLVGLYQRRDAARVPLRQQDLSLAERVVRTGVAQHVIGARLPGLVAELLEAASDDVAGGRSTDLEQQTNADLRVVEAVERCKAVLDAVGLEALARLQGDIESSEQLRSVDLGRREAPGWLDAAELTVMEVTTATGLGTHDIQSRLGLATCLTATARELRTRLQSGALSLHRACTIHTETRQLPDDMGLEIIDTVLREKDGAPPSPSLFRQRLSRACLAADREAGERRREARRKRRGAFALIEPDGLGALHVTNDADKIIGAMERVDAIARAARSGGDSRDLDSLRADVITDILMFGWPSTAEMPVSDDESVPPGPAGPVAAERAGTDTEAAGNAGAAQEAAAARRAAAEGVAGGETVAAPMAARGAEAAREAAADGGAGEEAVARASQAAGEAGAAARESRAVRGCGAAAGPMAAAQANDPGGRFNQPRVMEDWFTRLGQRPAAKVCIVVPFTTAVGVTDAPCEVPGYGWVVADHARQIILNAGSTWHRLAVDAETGAAVRLETSSYRPTAAMRAHVEAVDGTCRAPGCTVPAARCDLDHDIPWPHGATDVANLTSKHRQHHNAHTHGHWRVERDSEGLVRWRTKAGRTYETRPKDWLDGVRGQTTKQAVVVPLADDPPPF